MSADQKLPTTKKTETQTQPWQTPDIVIHSCSVRTDNSPFPGTLHTNDGGGLGGGIFCS